MKIEMFLQVVGDEEAGTWDRETAIKSSHLVTRFRDPDPEIAKRKAISSFHKIKKLLRESQLIGLILLLGSALAGFAQEPAAPMTPIEPLALSEVEQLKGENIRLKLDSLDKQMRLMQEQYARMQEMQQQLVQQLQALDEGILRARALPAAARNDIDTSFRVNWQTGKIERTEPQGHNDTEKSK